MPGVGEGEGEVAVEVVGFIEADGMEKVQRSLRFFFGIERKCRMVLRVAVAVGAPRIILLYPARIEQQDFAQVAGSMGGVYLASEALLDQQREIAAVIEMGVGQQDSFDRFGVCRKRFAVSQTQLFMALEQAAVDQIVSS